MLNDESSGRRFSKVTPVAFGASSSNIGGEVGSLEAPRQAIPIAINTVRATETTDTTLKPLTSSARRTAPRTDVECLCECCGTLLMANPTDAHDGCVAPGPLKSLKKNVTNHSGARLD